MIWFQHGDVSLQPATIPTTAAKTDRRTLAEGELTGHAHRLVDDADVEVYEHEGRRFPEVLDGYNKEN